MSTATPATIGVNRNFKGKVALVTGSSSGIGEEIAVHLCRLGASVTITGRNVERLKKVGDRCRKMIETNQSGQQQQVLEVIGNVSKDDDAKRLLDETIQKFKKLDILVNNAGIYQMAPIFDDNVVKIMDELYQTNVRSVVMLTKLAVPHLIKSKGNIVNVSSIASYKPAPVNTWYAMTKSAIDMLTKSLAVELGPHGVRCNAINPAAIRTPIFDKVPNSDLGTDKMAEIAAKSYPVRRIGEPQDCANAVAYLASDEASFINGVCLLVDGGSVYTSLILPDN